MRATVRKRMRQLLFRIFREAGFIITDLVDASVPCVNDNSHRMHLDMHTGQWDCMECRDSGDVFSLYASVKSDQDLDLMAPRICMFVGCARGVTDYNRCILSSSEKFTSIMVADRHPRVTPKITMSYVAARNKALMADEGFRWAIWHMLGIAKDDIESDRLGMEVDDRDGKILIVPELEFGELEGILAVDPFTGRLLGCYEREG